jgi:hypothetical protein
MVTAQLSSRAVSGTQSAPLVLLHDESALNKVLQAFGVVVPTKASMAPPIAEPASSGQDTPAFVGWLGRPMAVQPRICRMAACSASGARCRSTEARIRATWQPSPPSDSGRLTSAVLDYVMRHPGCVDRGAERQQYADGSRCFVLELYAQHSSQEPGAFAIQVAVPVGTLKDWLRHRPQATPAAADATAAVADDEHPARVLRPLLVSWRAVSPRARRSTHQAEAEGTERGGSDMAPPCQEPEESAA